MDISSAYPSKYVKSSDIPAGREIPLQIEDVRLDDMEQSNDQKPVLTFIGKQKGLVLNVTNKNTLVQSFGTETESWHGKTILIYATTTFYKGDQVPCLRVRVPTQGVAAHQQEAQQPATPQPATVGGPSTDEDCPF